MRWGPEWVALVEGVASTEAEEWAASTSEETPDFLTVVLPVVALPIEALSTAVLSAVASPINRGFVGRRFVHNRFGRRFAFFGPGIGIGFGLGWGWPYYDYANYGDSCWVWTPSGYINVCYYGSDYYY